MKKIKLTKNKFTIVDDEDYEILNQHKWYCLNDYAARDKITDKRKRTLYMHRLIMNCSESSYVDHVDGNPLNNRRENLRICSQSQNNMNRNKTEGNFSSRYKGVSFDKERNKWVMRLQKDGKCIIRKRFEKELDAAVFYNEMALKVYGEFAVLNKLQNE